MTFPTTRHYFGWIMITNIIYLLAIAFAFFLQSIFSVTISGSGFHVSLVYSMLLLGIFLLPPNWSSVAIVFFALVIDFESSNINGIYLTSYFFSLLPVFYFVTEIKKALFFPTFIIIFIACFFLKTIIELLLIIVFYTADFAIIHLKNSALLEAVLSTVAACVIYAGARMLFYRNWLVNLEKT